MRVAILSHQAPAGDAIGNSVADKTTFFLDRGAQVRVFLEHQQSIHPKIRSVVHRIGPGDASLLALNYMEEADLVLVEYGQYYPSLSLLPLLAGRKPRILLDYHGVTPPHLWSTHNREALLAGWQRRGIAWCADRVMLHSRFAADELHAACRFPVNRIVQIAHASGCNKEPCTTISPATIRDELGLANCKLALFVGRVAPNKRLGVAIKALARLKDREPAMHLLVVGNVSDLYRQELEACLELAGSLEVADRVHVLGQVDEQRLQACYAASDVFVMPSIHEGFCIPVVEAMAQGVPVVAAHAGALPETVGHAGLLFAADNDAELADRLRQVLGFEAANSRASLPADVDQTVSPRRRLRVAVVSFRFGAGIVGGAERSLTCMANALQDAGASVEIFTTCTRSESGWQNDVAAGSATESGLLVHRFAVDPVDRPRHDAIVRRVLEADGHVDAADEREFIRQSIHSQELVANLHQRIDDFDAILTGPYLAGLTHDLCQAFPDKVMLAPCFHDEAIARLEIWKEAYRKVGAVIYHSATEQSFAELQLGLNHPRSAVIGAWLEMQQSGDPGRGQVEAGFTRYLLYCGRFSEQKNLPLLLNWMRQFNAQRTDKLGLVLVGKGAVAIPADDWCRNLGFQDEQTKADLMAGALAVVNLSVNESLSLVALEAWANGTPVIAHADCAVLVDLIRASTGGVAVSDASEFGAAVKLLLEERARGQSMGSRARDFVAEEYGSRGRYMERLLDAVFSLGAPLAEVMKQRGRARAQAFSMANWKDEFSKIVEDTLDAPALPRDEDWAITPHRQSFATTVGQEIVFLPVRVRNGGNFPAVPDGPAAHYLIATTVANRPTENEITPTLTVLPGIVIPGETAAAVVRAAVPAVPGSYRVEIRCLREIEMEVDADRPAEAVVELVVSAAEGPIAGNCGPVLNDAVQSLVRADQVQTLPDDYTDVTEGRLAGIKRRVKQKLLGNFKQAYVDVLSRQQTAFNRAILQSLQETIECCSLLNHAVAASTPRGLQRLTETWSQTIEGAVAAGRTHEISDIIKDLLQEVAASRTRQNTLETRVAMLEASLHRPMSRAGSGE